ncbi:DUF1254 domain-containing protein, partial [Phenylobacterium sp.]|uniref:DUF1254 domain-containing protein n=1 Tax=Phenylobacterium sp. TaxID=1871053 RepID=UPI002F3FDB6A
TSVRGIHLNRRIFLVGSSLSVPAIGLAATTPLPLRQAARRMMIYGLPLIEIAQVRRRAFEAGQRANAFRHARALATPKQRTVTQPNVDTLYSTAWLDLSQGPVTVTLPPTGDRYFSLALMDAYTNNFVLLGTRTMGGDGGVVTIVGPNGAGPKGAIRAPTDWVWALGRTLVDGPRDMAAAHAVQDGLKLEGPAGREPLAYPARSAPWPELFAGLQALIEESPPPATDLKVFHETSALGLTPAGTFDPSRFDAAQGREIEAGIAEALAFAKGAADAGERRGGWAFPRQDLGDFRQDYDYRAQVALSGLAAMPLEEAVYMRALNAQGHDEIDSRVAWRLRFPAGQTPPVDAFWSLTAYEITPEGQGFLVDNPIDRYAIGDRTPGLVRGRDGALEILIAPKDPGPAHRANWLPAPSSGRPMVLSLRAYLPRPELATGIYRVPDVVRA